MNIKQNALLLGLAGLMAGCASSSPYNNIPCELERQPIPAPVEEAPITRIVNEEINLSADALFKFDRYKVADLLPKGRTTLDELADKLTNGYAEIKQIDLVGHTDRLGSEQYNDKLGLNRAKTVKAYLASKGVTAPMNVKSAGELQPVTDGCQGVSPRSALKACLQPDRRVVVNIFGVKTSVTEEMPSSETN
ncbi:MAG: hypothetical protein CSA42_02720 [Gammaproteobacteria bacterium]|nr:MAG: hypothetical protein CSA42_02720 [Gammaproteobacteria bacterium]